MQICDIVRLWNGRSMSNYFAYVSTCTKKSHAASCKLIASILNGFWYQLTTATVFKTVGTTASYFAIGSTPIMHVSYIHLCILLSAYIHTYIQWRMHAYIRTTNKHCSKFTVRNIFYLVNTYTHTHLHNKNSSHDTIHCLLVVTWAHRGDALIK